LRDNPAWPSCSGQTDAIICLKGNRNLNFVGDEVSGLHVKFFLNANALLYAALVYLVDEVEQAGFASTIKEQQQQQD
jgi:hypothetical protein